MQYGELNPRLLLGLQALPHIPGNTNCKMHLKTPCLHNLVAIVPFTFYFLVFAGSATYLYLNFMYTCGIATFSELPHFQGGTTWNILIK